MHLGESRLPAFGVRAGEPENLRPEVKVRLKAEPIGAAYFPDSEMSV